MWELEDRRTVNLILEPPQGHHSQALTITVVSRTVHARLAEGLAGLHPLLLNY